MATPTDIENEEFIVVVHGNKNIVAKRKIGKETTYSGLGEMTTQYNAEELAERLNHAAKNS